MDSMARDVRFPSPIKPFQRCRQRWTHGIGFTDSRIDCARSRLHSAARLLKVVEITSGLSRGEAAVRSNRAWPLFIGTSWSGAVIRHSAISVPWPRVSTSNCCTLMETLACAGSRPGSTETLSDSSNRDRLAASVRWKHWSSRSAHRASSIYSISLAPLRTTMEFRRRYEGIFTNPIPTDQFPFTGAGSFAEMGARTKWRVETVTGFNRHPVRSMPVRAADPRLVRRMNYFMAVPLVVFFLSTRRWD